MESLLRQVGAVSLSRGTTKTLGARTRSHWALPRCGSALEASKSAQRSPPPLSLTVGAPSSRVLDSEAAMRSGTK